MNNFFYTIYRSYIVGPRISSYVSVLYSRLLYVEEKEAGCMICIVAREMMDQAQSSSSSNLEYKRQGGM